MLFTIVDEIASCSGESDAEIRNSCHGGRDVDIAVWCVFFYIVCLCPKVFCGKTFTMVAFYITDAVCEVVSFAINSDVTRQCMVVADYHMFAFHKW